MKNLGKITWKFVGEEHRAGAERPLGIKRLHKYTAKRPYLQQRFCV
jgi:hypothetical protein